MKYISLPAILLSCICTASCSNRIGDWTVASTKNMDLKHIQGYTTQYNARTKGECRHHYIILFRTGLPDLKEPLDRAIEKNGPNCVGLANVTMTNKWWYIPFLYGQDIYIAEGDPIFRKD